MLINVPSLVAANNTYAIVVDTVPDNVSMLFLINTLQKQSVSECHTIQLKPKNQ